MNVLDLYHKALETKTEITYHAPYLRSLAEQCSVAAEFGVRSGVSTYAILAGCLQRLTRMLSYDIQDRDNVAQEASKAAPEVFSFTKRDTSKEAVDVPVDLLLIDTKHTASQLRAELDLNHALVRRWIVLHDTELFGMRGEGGEEPGLLIALREFLDAHSEWFISRHVTESCGLTTLSRNPADRPQTEIKL